MTENQVDRIVFMESAGLKEADSLDRTKWKNDTHNHSGDNRLWENPEEKKRLVRIASLLNTI